MSHRYLLDRLRHRLDEMEQRHGREIATLRAELDAMDAVDEYGDKEATVPEEQPPPLPTSRPVVEVPDDEFEVAVPSRPAEPLAVGREIDFGRVWFVRVGVVILLTGLVFLGNYAYQNWIRELPNGARLAALLVLAGAWVETGRRLARRDNLRRFGAGCRGGAFGSRPSVVCGGEQRVVLRAVRRAVAGAIR